MKQVVIVAGYGDRTDYIEHLTARWPQKYDLEPHVYAFGTLEAPETYEDRWQEFEDKINVIGQTAVIGVSFGFSIAARAMLEHPEQVDRIVSIAGPHDLSAVNQETLDKKYPMLNRSLSAFNDSLLPVDRVMTLSPLIDPTVSPANVIIQGAKNHKVPMFGHGPGIVAAFLLREKTIASFIHGNNLA